MSADRAPGRTRLLRLAVAAVLAGVVLGANLPTIASFAEQKLHEIEINSQGYKEREGHWSILDVPSRFRINAVHAALLYTGKVLIIAGSGNSAGFFKAGTFKSIIWNPATNTFKLIRTPSDMFCGGHAFLPDGKLLIAGGTSRYEVLGKEIRHAAGVMLLHNSASGSPVTVAAGTEFRSPTGVLYRSTTAATLPAARTAYAADGAPRVQTGTAEVWAEAVAAGRGSALPAPQNFTVLDGAGAVRPRLEGRSIDGLTTSDESFWGSKKSYLFNPQSESYEQVSDMDIARWYPTLVGLADGRVLAVSGLDQFGQIVTGQTEIYTPANRTWTPVPGLIRELPTYPTLFLLPSGRLFFTGSNAGYGPATGDRMPGIWDIADNSFRPVPGIAQSQDLETSASVLLPPAQRQRYMVIGGGGVGESPLATGRTAIADLSEREPHFTPGPSLPQPTRYPEAVITPDNRVVIAGGSRDYRGKHGSDLFECHSFDPATGKLTGLAAPLVGRDYHAEALLLPDGRIVTLGGNPLFGNAQDTSPGYFETKIEIYSPPYLYHGGRPQISAGPRSLGLGSEADYNVTRPAEVQTVSLIRPSAYTHVMNLEQRSIALSFTSTATGVHIAIPDERGLVPAGYYMLFVTNRRGTPSPAYWVHVA